MIAKISRTVLALFCAAMILLLPFTGGYRQAFLADDPEDSFDTGESDIPEPSVNGNENKIPEESSAPEEESVIESQGEQMEEPLPAPGEEIIEKSVPKVENAAVEYSLDTNERVVKTFAELKNALSVNNGVTVVHLGANITMQSGIHIDDSKTSVVVDGMDPTNPDQIEPYTLTELDSMSFTDTIYINSTGVKNVRIRDLKIVGKNYYGPFSAQDAAATAGLILTFERVDYNGPQIGYHRRGTLHMIDCAVRLHGKNGTSPSQEFSEAKNIVFEGVNTIDTATTTTGIFWHPYGGMFTIADDSSVTLTSPNTSGTYGIFYADGSSYSIDITIGQSSVFDATIATMVAPVGYVTFSSLTVQEGGGFYLTTTKAAGMAVFSMGGNLVVEPDAAFKIKSYGDSDYPVLNLRTGNVTVGKGATFHITSSNTSSSLLNLYGRSLIVDDPASVLFYNAGNRDILATTTSGGVSISAGQINYWNTAAADRLDSPPLYHWEKKDGSNIRMNGTLETGTSGNFSSLSHNYVTGDLPGTAPSAATFNMESARVLAFGRLELLVNTPVATSTEITGVTAPGAAVRASFNQQGILYTMPDVMTGENGIFSIPVDVPLLSLTDITVRSSYQYLTATVTTTVGEAGQLTFTVPDQLYFHTTELAPITHTVKRLRTDWHLLISDTRGPGTTWRVYVKALEPLTPVNSSRPALENALVFVGDTGIVTPLNTTDALLIYQHTTASNNEVANISWTSDRGILVRIPTGAAYSDQTYFGELEWSVVDAP